MTSGNKKNKFVYDTRLFMTEPPDDSALVGKLFCGRQQEVQRALDTLKHNMDRDGKRGAKKPWVIVGESRSGKSHLARYVMSKLKKTRGDKKYHFIVVSARERLDAFEVVKLLFEQLRTLYRDLRRDVNFSVDSLPEPIRTHAETTLSVVDQIVDRVSHFIEQGTETLEFSFNESEVKALQGQATLSIPKIFKLSVQASRSQQDGTAQKVVFRQPSIDDLTSFCQSIIDTLSWVKLLDHVLILVDDIDLLEGYQDPAHSGQIQRNRLIDAMLKLHQMPYVDVLFTARSWYGQTHKELHVLVDLAAASPLGVEDLQTIHNKHFQAFVRNKKLPKQFLEPDALRYVAEQTGFLPGVFLQVLKNAFHQDYKSEEGWEPRDVAWLLGAYQKRFQSLLQRTPDAASHIQQAIHEDNLNVDVRANNPFFRTTAMDEFVFQSYYSETVLFIPPFIKEVINSMRPVLSSPPSLAGESNPLGE